MLLSTHLPRRCWTAAFPRLRRKGVEDIGVGFRMLSTENGEPLFLWLGREETSSSAVAAKEESSTAGGRLLLPVSVPDTPTVFTSADALDLVNARYENNSHFVGGMGESDPGVWFATRNAADDDPLNFLHLIQESISSVKQERHGVPFGLYTSGIIVPEIPLGEIGLDSCQVSLFAGSPTDYSTATGRDASMFGQVCGFIAATTEEGVPVEVGVLKQYASSARDLALSLGAREVHVYD